MGLLDDQPYQQTHPDAVRLLLVLTKHLWDSDEAKVLVLASGIDGGRIFWGQPMADAWPYVLQEAGRVGRLRRLVEKAAAAVPAEPLFAELLRQSAVPVPAATTEDVWVTARLWTTDALIDRGELRDHVRAMRQRDGQRALLVMGEEGTGKSHTHRFMNYLSDRGEIPRVWIIDNSRRAGPAMTVQELAQLVASTLAGMDAPTFDLVAQAESIAARFRGWLIHESENFTDTMWIVFDGFTAQTATAPALQLIHDLVAAVADRQLGMMRVAVLGFGDDASRYHGALREPLRHPTDDEVRAFFKRMSKTLQGVEADDDAVEELFTDFVAKGGPVGGRKLCELGPSALAQAVAVFGASA